jgi:hypothetical protein
MKQIYFDFYSMCNEDDCENYNGMRCKDISVKKEWWL